MVNKVRVLTIKLRTQFKKTLKIMMGGEFGKTD